MAFVPAPPQAEPVVCAGAVLIDASGRVLLIQRALPPAAGTWSLPGGRLEAGETPDQAVVREVLEETALAADIVCPLGLVEVGGPGGERFLIHEYLVRPRDTEPSPRAGDDAAAVRWAVESDLGPLQVTAAVRRVIALALAQAQARGLLA
jgi:mutator protein MutT